MVTEGDSSKTKGVEFGEGNLTKSDSSDTICNDPVLQNDFSIPMDSFGVEAEHECGSNTGAEEAESNEKGKSGSLIATAAEVEESKSDENSFETAKEELEATGETAHVEDDLSTEYNEQDTDNEIETDIEKDTDNKEDRHNEIDIENEEDTNKEEDTENEEVTVMYSGCSDNEGSDLEHDDRLAQLVSVIREAGQECRRYRGVGFHYNVSKKSYPRECRFMGFLKPRENIETYPQDDVGFCFQENCLGASLLYESVTDRTAWINNLSRKRSAMYRPVVKSRKINDGKNNDAEFLGFVTPSEDLTELFGRDALLNEVPKKKTRQSFIELIVPKHGDSLDRDNEESEDENMDSEIENEIEPMKETISDYERIRLENIKERTRALMQMGIVHQENRVEREKKIIKVKVPSSNESSRKKHPTRRSVRLSNGASDFYSLPYHSASEDEDDKQTKSYIKRPNSYGAIKGTEVGEWWSSRLECNAAGIHRPTVAGIHPGPKGAYSVVLSGGYDDDVDYGHSFTYTGSGGRDLKGTKTNPKNLRTAPQSKNQTLNLSNAALVYSCEHRKPIRVVRGYKLRSDYAPEEGYRYDGLYIIEKWWLSEGKSGFLTYKFLFKRCEDQEQPPWTTESSNDSSFKEE